MGMQKLFLSFIILALTLTITHPLQATVADPRPHTLTQPDGSTLTVRQHGDEWFSWMATPDGYRIVKNQAGIYEYAHPDATQGVKPGGIPARDMAHRSPSDLQYLSTLPLHAGVTPQLIEQSRLEAFGKSMLKSTAATTYFPSAGNRNLLVILVNFSDTQTQYTQSDFHNLMNQPNYNGAGSFNDYYREVSDANTPLNITATVVNWVQLPQTHDYYTSNVGELVITAIEETAKTGGNFDAFDNDNDGTIESVMIVHQGSGRESSTISTDIWSHYHMLSYYSAYSTTASRTFGGKIFNQYVIVPEQNGAQTGISPIGVFCHEFGHALGMVDYYNTIITTNTYSGTGKWDLMANGLWNTDGHVPAHPNPYEKIRLGWATQQTIDTRGSYTLPPVLTSQTIFRINSPDASEYFLLENRILSNFDAFLPGPGMLLYHVDTDIISAKWSSNKVNAATPQGMALLPALNNLTNANCPFPGTGNVTAITDFTTANLRIWDGTMTQKQLTNIATTPQGDITFDYAPVEYLMEPPVIVSHSLTNNEASLTWNPVIDENFLAYAPLSHSIDHWTFYDGDKSETYNVRNDATKYIIIPKYTGSFVVGATHDTTKLYPYIGNRFLGCVSAQTPPNNDWIISPQIEITGTAWLSFMARSLTATFGMDRLNVLISETDNSPASFIKLNTEPYLEAPESWTLFKYDLSAYLGKKVYFAIQCVSHDALMLMIDAIRVTQSEPTCCSFLKSASTPMPLQTLWDKSNEEVTTASHPLKSTAATAGDIQYNIYRNQQLVGTQTGMTNTTFTETVPCGSYDYHIEAVRTIPAAASQSATVTVACNSTDLPQLPGNEATAFYDVLLNCVTIDTPDTNYRLYNASGSLLKQGNTPMVDTQGLPAGLYLLQYSAHQRLHTFKFCKP